MAPPDFERAQICAGGKSCGQRATGTNGLCQSRYQLGLDVAKCRAVGRAKPTFAMSSAACQGSRRVSTSASSKKAITQS